MKKNRSLLFFCLLCFTFLLAGRVFAFEATVQFQSDKVIRIKWKKQKKATKYVVKRQGFKYGKNPKSFKKIKTLGKNSTGFTEKKLKYGWVYNYEILAYNAKGKNYATAETELFMGSALVQWDEYQRTDTDFSTKKIPLMFYREAGIKPDGYLIYRKDLTLGEKKFKKIATVKGTKKTLYTYTDKKVTAGHSYSYRIRSYIKRKGKKKYGPYTENVLMNAVPKNALLSVSWQEALSDMDNGLFTVCVTSMKDNATVFFSRGEYMLDDPYPVYLSLERYSKDGTTWTPCPNELSLSAGETLYLQFETDEEGLKLKDEFPSRPIITSEDAVTYNYLTSELNLDTSSGSGRTSINMEYYH